jgi:O-antigen/teichoic acid export membrane protein
MKTPQIFQSYLTNFFSQLTKNIDIFLAAYFFDGEMLAIYALGSRVAQLFGFIYSGYMAPLAGQIVNAFASKATKSFWKFIAQNMAVILLVMLVAYCVSYFMLDFVVAYSFGEGFGGVFEVFFVLSLASLLNCLSGPTLLLLRTCGYASYAFYSSLLALVPYVYMLFHPPTSLIDLALYPVAGTVVMKSCSAVFLYTNHYKGAV